jgi:hypothetical protein
MATKTGGSTKNRNAHERRKLKEIDQRFPGQSVEGRPVMPDKDIASIREMRNDGNAEVDTEHLTWMLGCNRRKVAREYASAHEGRFHWRTNEKDRNELMSLLKKSYMDQKVSAEIAQYRNFEITSDLLAMPFALGAFQSINLSADELPMIITPKARQYFQVRYIGQDGGPHQDQWRTTKSAENIEMNMLSTDKIEYPLMDLQQGDVNAFSVINEQLRFDMEMKIDDLALQNLDSGKVVSGLKALLNIHPLINQANLPDTNYLDLTNTGTYGTANTWTLPRLKALLDHISKWGFGFDPDGAITIQSMIMSPQNARDSWDYVDLVSGYNSANALVDSPTNTIPSSMRENIMSTGGMIQSGWGHSWTTQYNARLAKGRAYVFTNQPVGWFFTKSEWDKTIEWKDHPDFVDQNIGQVVQKKTARFYMPSLWAYRYVIIDF